MQRAGVLKRGMRMLDIGTGSGILAFAAAKLAHAKVVASDNDAESILVAKENVRSNGLSARIRLAQATGFRARLITRNKPYALIVSNIFANPLARLAPAMRAHLAPGGRVILAGFLQRDAHRVRNAYAQQRIYLERRQDYGSWVILQLRKPAKTKKMKAL
jgi:ribosomal protein L11 methyltransferase